MTRHFRPSSYSRATDVTVTFPVSGFADLLDPVTGRTVVPQRVELALSREEGTPDGEKFYASVLVAGPRRLKSGETGREITSLGWHREVVDGPHGRELRPEELTKVLEENVPDGWDRSLLDLPERANTPAGGGGAWRDAAQLVAQLVADGEHDPDELVAALLQRAAIEDRARGR